MWHFVFFVLTDPGEDVKLLTVKRPRCGFPFVFYLCVVGLEVIKASSYVLGISEDWLLEMLTVSLMWFSLSGELSAVPNGTWVDLIDPYVLGLLKHIICLCKREQKFSLESRMQSSFITHIIFVFFIIFFANLCD